jgi:protein-S-isoprenylcysteine O-methyltransferase Ste14/uncharacterized membrane protein (UPF0127 family)
MQAWETTTGTIVADRLRSAHTHWARLRGLLGTRTLEDGEGLWLRPCRQIHMIGMRYPVDLAFLDDRQRVVHTVTGIGPGRISPRVAHAASVLELPAGKLARSGVREGSHIGIAGDTVPPRRAGRVWLNLALAAVYLFFASAHASFAWRTGQWGTTAPIVLQETMLVVLFVARRAPRTTSTRPLDWTVGIAGAVLPLFMRAVDTLGPLAWIGRPMQMAALLVSVLAIAALGRSWGIIAANRGVKTGGAYRIVRHPVYACHLVSYLGYVACYPTARNLVLAALTSLALAVRAHLEERLLVGDEAYRAYRARVPWRFLPFVY